MYSSIKIANYFIAKSLEEKNYLTPMKLQKLVFFAHGWYLATTGKPLLDEQVEAWQFGPVVQTLYHKVKSYGNNVIKGVITDFDITKMQDVAPVIDGDDLEIKKFLDSIWNVYKMYSGVQLSNITHIEGSPWHVIVNKPENKPLKKHTDIPEQLIKDYFKNQLTKNQSVAQ